MPSILSISLFNADNKGYFGGLEFAKELISQSGYSSSTYVVYSNCDICISSSFFSTVASLHSTLPSSCIVAPRIYDPNGRAELNPKYVNKPTYLSLVKLLFIYSFPPIAFLYQWLANYSASFASSFPKKNHRPCEPVQIFAPHGSCFIFRGIDLFSALPNYPVFLFGEELFIGIQASRSAIPVIFAPNIIIYDWPHSSISLKNFSWICSRYRQSLRFLLSNWQD
jgi:GT2 family glycosyltransferase